GVAQALAWLLGVALTLVPWMTYSWRATGVPLVKSTNQGHVLLLGLGQDPKGRFGFTYSDGDPRMYAILRDQLGDAFARRFYASCSYEADRVLRPAFTTAVLIRPWDYADLVHTKLRRILTGSVGTLRGRVRSRRESRPVRHRGEDSQSPEPALAADRTAAAGGDVAVRAVRHRGRTPQTDLAADPDADRVSVCERLARRADAAVSLERHPAPARGGCQCMRPAGARPAQ